MFLWQNKNTHACLLPGALGQELGGPSVFDPWRPLIREHRGKWRHRLGEQWGGDTYLSNPLLLFPQ